ncbi:MAG: penicillin-binding protein 1A [Armatimonadetes bacterium]|nr:penicillin-binding protein 1A [Armatimonadota bacterium]
MHPEQPVTGPTDNSAQQRQTSRRGGPRRDKRSPSWLRAARVAPRAGVVLLVAVLAVGTLAGLAAAFSLVPDISKVYDPPSEATRIYAANGELIASVYRENREYVTLDQIPLSMQQAVIAIEDERFFGHSGIDLEAIARAMWRNLRARELREGGSTITQQLARNVFLTPDRTLRRKVAEIVLALEIERRLTKHEILERYLNQVYFGQGAYGIEMAAQVYFGKPAQKLTLAESAMLAGLIRAPSLYSPYRNLDLARYHQRLVLKRMAQLGYITREQAYEAAARQPLWLARLRNVGLTSVRAPYFVSYVLPYLIERFGEERVYRGGLQVYTTLDLPMQIAAEQAVRHGLDEAREQRLNATQGALVTLDVHTGYIRAMIGGYDFWKSQFNRAFQARRQPGSAFKPFIYTTAIEAGWRSTKVLLDAPVSYRSGVGWWHPKNYDGKFRGPVTMRTALEKSINIPAIRTLNTLRTTRVIAVARRMGIQSPLEPNLSLALGSSDVTLLELASAYATLASMGVRSEPIAISRVIDQSGKVLEQNVPQRRPALESEVAYRMIDILKGVITRGTGRAARIGRPVAGKTGTSDDYRNAWFIGFTPHLLTAVWVGNDDNSPMNKVVGGTVPARTWAAFMRTAVASMPADDWDRPEGVEIEVRRPSPPAAVVPPNLEQLVRETVLQQLRNQLERAAPVQSNVPDDRGREQERPEDDG